MTSAKFYSQDDVELARAALNELPDLKKARLTKADVLSELKPAIVSLYDDKGYTVEDIRAALENVGIQASTKAIREMVIRKKMAKKTSTSSTRSAPSGSVEQGNTPAASGGQTGNQP